MRNKVNVIGKTMLIIFVIFALFNMGTCGSNTSSMKKVEGPSIQTNKHNHYSSSINRSHVCPLCKGNYRSFYTLPSEQSPAQAPTILLICNGCLTVWLKPANIALDRAASSKDFKKEFKKGFRKTFRESNGHWSTEEVNNSEWHEVMRENPLLLYDAAK